MRIYWNTEDGDSDEIRKQQIKSMKENKVIEEEGAFKRKLIAEQNCIETEKGSKNIKEDEEC